MRQDVAWFDREDNSTGALTARLATEATLVKNIVGQNLSRCEPNIRDNFFFKRSRRDGHRGGERPRERDENSRDEGIGK